MKIKPLFKFTTSVLAIFIFCTLLSGYDYRVKKGHFVSLVPSLTEMVYAIGAQDNLVGVTTQCNYPIAAKSKPSVGDTLFLNKEKIIRLKPEYIFALESQRPLIDDLKKVGIKPVYYNFLDVNALYKEFIVMGEKSNRQKSAQNLVKNLQLRISKIKAKKPKKILYLVQNDPLITIGKKSFINDLIIKSGHRSITSDLNFEYPKISKEFAFISKPDVVVVNMFTDIKDLKTIFPKSRFVIMTRAQMDVINRPGPRIYKAIQFFAEM